MRNAKLWLARFVIRVRGFLAGKKTYVIAFATILYSLGIKRGWWPSDIEIWGLLGSSGLVTLRVAWARTMKQFLDDMTVASATPMPTIK
jgi:hypothetical protein